MIEAVRENFDGFVKKMEMGLRLEVLLNRLEKLLDFISEDSHRWRH